MTAEPLTVEQVEVLRACYCGTWYPGLRASVGDVRRLVATVDDLRRQLDAAHAVIAGGIVAMQLTREYVGVDVLPAIEGWSWFDWTKRAEAALGSPAPASDPQGENLRTPAGLGEHLSRLGARLGNWNDRTFGPEMGRHPHRAVWQRVDRLASWFFVLPERPRRR